ncbi:DUF4332 domain-containing protein [Geminocystis sp. CENA526]|uniref:DUF4332 domain-containing protein n=1 Tax=Geminocystis sp. CENA526 TaxID=1355871 RepID=UPI003D702048
MSYIDIALLPGITSIDLKNLKNLGIDTNLALLKYGCDRPKQQELAIKMGVNLKNVLKWIALADLSRLESVGNQYCGLILHSGVISCRQLAQTSVPQLHRQILKLQVSHFGTKKECPPLSLVKTWVKEARQLGIRN